MTTLFILVLLSPLWVQLLVEVVQVIRRSRGGQQVRED